MTSGAHPSDSQEDVSGRLLGVQPFRGVLTLHSSCPRVSPRLLLLQSPTRRDGACGAATASMQRREGPCGRPRVCEHGADCHPGGCHRPWSPHHASAGGGSRGRCTQTGGAALSTMACRHVRADANTTCTVAAATVIATTAACVCCTVGRASAPIVSCASQPNASATARHDQVRPDGPCSGRCVAKRCKHRGARQQMAHQQ